MRFTRLRPGDFNDAEAGEHHAIDEHAALPKLAPEEQLEGGHVLWSPQRLHHAQSESRRPQRHSLQGVKARRLMGARHARGSSSPLPSQSGSQLAAHALALPPHIPHNCPLSKCPPLPRQETSPHPGSECLHARGEDIWWCCALRQVHLKRLIQHLCGGLPSEQATW